MDNQHKLSFVEREEGGKQMDENNAANALEIDEVLPLVGGFGKFQKIVVLFMSLMQIPIAILILIPYFVQDNPKWKCVENSTVCLLNGTFGRESPLYKERCSMRRSDWMFTKPRDYSIVTQFDIYCEREPYIYLATSVVFISWAFGAVVLGWLADRYGRKRIALPCYAALLVFGFISAFSPNLTFYIIARLLLGFVIPGVNVQNFVLYQELISPKRRQLAASLTFAAFAFAMVLLGVTAIFVQSWKNLLLVFTAPFFLSILAYIFIPESTRWLRLNGKSQQAIDILKQIGKFNKKDVPDFDLVTVQQDTSKGKSHFVNLFRPKKIAITSLIQGYAWIVQGLVYYGVSFGADDLGGSKYRDYILSSILDFPAALISTYTANRFGRKKSTLLGTLIAGIACIVVSLIPARSGPNNERSSLTALRVVCGMIGKLSITISFDVIYVWSNELYPTVVRSVGMGYLQITSRIGSALAPWVVKWLKIVHIILPFSLMGGSAIVCAILLLWLPETANKKTAETLEDQFDKTDSCKEQESKLVVHHEES